MVFFATLIFAPKIEMHENNESDFYGAIYYE